MTDEELKHRHLIRRARNAKHKARDRFRPKGAYRLYDYPIRHYGENDYEFNRRKAPPLTGFGVAWERRPSCEVK